MYKLRLFKDKKGSPYYLFIVAMAGFVALSFCWYIVVHKTQGAERTIGDNQFALLNVYQFGEEFKFYIDQSARYSAYFSIYNLSVSGGTDQVSACGDYKGYRLWNLQNTECFPGKEETEGSFLRTFNNTLNNYLQQYLPSSSKLNYSFYLLEKDPVRMRAIPQNKLDLIISKSDSLNKAHPNVKAIVLGDAVDSDLIEQKILENEVGTGGVSP